MAKKKKIEKVTSITTADEYGNAKTIKLTGNTGGYNYNSKTGVSTPALSAVGRNDARTVKTNQLNNQQDTTSDIRTIKTEDTKKQDDVKTAIKKYGDTLKNSQVKNNGFSLSNAITDLANIYDANKNIAKSIPGIGKIYDARDKALSTVENIATNMGTGAMKSVESAADMASDLVFNPLERKYNYAFDLLTKGKKTADENLKDLKKMQQRDIKRNQTEDFQKATGYSDIVDDREKNSLVTRENAGGQFSQMVGGMVPQLVLGQALGGTTPLKELKGLKGKELAKAVAQNTAINFQNQLPANLMLAGQSYGGGLEDALNKGKSLSQSRLYGGVNIANEAIPELLFGGVPGLGGKGGIDNLVEPILDKGYKGYANPLVKGLYKATGEGLEEKLTTYLDALARQGILGEKIDWDQIKKDSNRDFLYGALMGGFLDAPETIQGIQEVRTNKRNDANGNISNNNDTVVPNTNQIREIVEQKNNGEIDAEEANRRIADVQNGTYQQNQNNQAVIQEAQRQFDAIQQAEASGVIDTQTANQERQALTNTINQMTQQNGTQERVVQETQQETQQETPKQEIKSNDNKAEQVENQTIKVEQKKKTSPLDILTESERQQYDKIREKQTNGQPLSQEDKNTLRSFQNKWNNYKEAQQRKVENIKNIQENKSNIKFEDLSKDLKATRYDKSMYAKAKNTDMDMSEYDKTMEFITPNRAGNYSKQQILTLAEELGKKSKATTGAELKQEAINYWVNKEPYKKTDSKTKYLGMDEFLKAYYKGAGVGTKIETQETTQTETQKATQEPSLKNAKNYYNRNLGKYTPGDAFESAIGEYQLRPEEAENLRDYTIKKYPDYADEINRRYNDLYKQEETTKIEEPSKEKPKVEQPRVEEKPKQEESKSTESIKEIRQEVEEKTNKTMSKHIETSSKATNTVEDIKNMNYDDIVYDEKTHKASQEQALRELEGKDTDTNVNDIHAKFRGTERLTNVDSAKITELMKQTKALADEAAKNNNDTEYNKRMEQFRTLKGDYAVALSESGQFTEYAKVIKELDPETQVDVLEKVIDREKRRGNKKYEDVTLNEDLIEKHKNAKTDEERDAIMEEIKDDTARQIKITLADKANEFRFLSMLGNVKTHGRNIFGNVGMYSLQSFKDGVAAIGEDVYNKVSKNGLETRSKTLKPATKEVSNFVNEKVDSFMTDITNKYNESRGMKGDLEGRTKKFSDNNIIGKALNKVSDINSKALDFEDKFFSSKMTKQAMKGFLTANGIETNADIEAHPELVAQALDYALFKGKEATFHQDSTTATAIRNLRDKLYTGSGFSKLGGLAIDTTLPFVSTPANIAKNALEYTPIIGFGDINKQFQNAPNNMKANVLIDSLSKQFTGGALMAVGAYLASQGLVKGSGDDDKEDKTEASLGNASYSIKIGNSTYDLSWLAPTAIPFFEGVEVFNAFKKANSKGGIKATDTADLIDTMFGTLNPMTDMSVLQSIERVITSITYGGNAVKSATSTTFSSYLQQYIPTLFSQIAQVGDTKQRNTNTGANVIDKTIDQIKYKIPASTEFTAVGKWLNKNLTRKSLPEKVDVWGNTNKTSSNIWQRGFEAFLSPANRKDYKVDKTTKELERLARETDDTAMLPTVKNKKLRVNGEDHDLKGKDYVNLQKTYGKTAKKNLDKLTKSKAYKNADDNEKKSMVGKLYDYASYKAKENYAKKKGINFDSGNQTSFAMIDAFGIPYEKYVENQVSGNQGAADMLNNLNKAGLSEAQKGAVMNYFDRAYYVNEDELYNMLENSDLSDKQKELIRAKYEENITDKERERYQRADNIGVDYDLYTNFRSFVNKARGESRSGGPTKKQKVINWIQEQELTAEQKQNLYNDYINNQGIFSYYK